LVIYLEYFKDNIFIDNSTLQLVNLFRKTEKILIIYSSVNLIN